MRSPAPFDRAVALACRAVTLRAYVLELRCCGVTMLPLRLLCRDGWHSSRSLADISVRLRCRQCGKPPAGVALLETSQAVPEAYGGPQGWRVHLMGQDKLEQP